MTTPPSRGGARNGLPRPGPGGRLPSFKGKRDLSLGVAKGGAGGAEKKKFTPNLNVQRKKCDDAAAGPAEIKVEPGLGRGGARGGARGGGRHEFKPKPRPELIQTMGSVFSDGITLEGIKRRSGGGGGFGDAEASPALQRPVLPSRGSVSQYDKEAEDKRLKALLQDDFIADLSCEGLYVPVQLPMIDTGKVFQDTQAVKSEEADEEDDIIRSGHPSRHRILDSDEEDSAPAQPAPKAPVPKVDPKEPVAELTFPDLVRRQNGDLLFIQLPDHLPGSLQVKKERVETAQESARDRCALLDLPEGYLGRIQVRKSGLTQLKLGEDFLDVELGTQVGFLQDLVSIETSANPREVGDITILGHVKNRVVCTPNWEHLLSSYATESASAQKE